MKDTMQRGLNDRQQNLLYHIVHDYIVSATPVGSEFLAQRCHLGISPATVRNEMAELADLGYLQKQHISSGRVPTMQAYRFFVDHISSKKEKHSPAYLRRALEALEATQREDCAQALRNLVEKFSSLAHTLTIGYYPHQNLVWRDGMEYFLEEPEFSTCEALKQATMFTERLHDVFFAEFQDFFDGVRDLKIFIGEENPLAIDDRQHYSLMVAPLHVGKRKEAVFFTLVGPLRMAYDNNMSLLDIIMRGF